MKLPSLDKLSGERPPAVVLADLSLVRPVGMAKIPVILGSARAEDETRLSRYVTDTFTVPGWTGEHSASSARVLVELGGALHAALGRKVPLIYESDVHLDLLYRHRRALAEHYLFLVNDEELAWALYDKERFHALATRAGIAVPRTCSGEDLAGGALAADSPVVVKPKRKTSYRDIQRLLFDGRGKARVFGSPGALLSHPGFARHRDELLVQEHVEAAVTDLVSFHGYADERGEILASFCGRKARTSPMFGGESSFIELTTDPVVAAVGGDVARRLGLKGPFKIDLIRDARTGALLTLEINARFNLWHYLGAVDGVNLPLVAYDYLVFGRRPSPAPVAAPRHRWVDFYRDYQAFLEQKAKGEMTLPGWLWSIAAPRNVFAVFAWDDPRPFAAWAGKFLRERRSQRGAAAAGAAAEAVPAGGVGAPREQARSPSPGEGSAQNR